MHKYELSCMNTHQNSISSVYYFILRMYQFLLTIYSYLYTIHYITSSKNASLAKPFKNFVFSQCIFQLSDNFFNFIVTLYINCMINSFSSALLNILLIDSIHDTLSIIKLDSNAFTNIYFGSMIPNSIKYSKIKNTTWG